MKTLLIGGGGREHAIAAKLAVSPLVTELYCAPGNAGIAALATCIPIAATDIDALVDYAVREVFDFVVVAPDDPLALGLVDRLEAAGVPAAGPTAAAARIEASKAFSKQLMREHEIPTAEFESFTDLDLAARYLKARWNDCRQVIKVSGLALGKGALLPETLEDALETLKNVQSDFGSAAETVVIEDRMQGKEVTVLAFTDGKTISPMPPCRDHKRARDGDQGANTGGMGVITPVADFTPALHDVAMETIFKPTIRALREEGCPFQGVIYFELMLAETDGVIVPKVIEYNARFGDPEAQTVLPLLETDLMEILLHIREEALHELPIHWKGGAACCVVAASGGYPGGYQKGLPIRGLDTIDPAVHVYHAGTAQKDSAIVTNGGRVLALTATAPTLDAAKAAVYAEMPKVQFDGCFYRNDIGGR